MNVSRDKEEFIMGNIAPSLHGPVTDGKRYYFDGIIIKFLKWGWQYDRQAGEPNDVNVMLKNEVLMKWMYKVIKQTKYI